MENGKLIGKVVNRKGKEGEICVVYRDTNVLTVVNWVRWDECRKFVTCVSSGLFRISDIIAESGHHGGKNVWCDILTFDATANVTNG